MRVLCAPDSFKGTLTAGEAAQAMARGVQLADGSHVADACPVADGGEGSLDALIAAMTGSIEIADVTGPLGEPITARYGLVSNRALGIVELAEASGLLRVPNDRRDPTRTTTYGTGELIRLLMDRDVSEVLVCLGGSATVDGGAGLAQALGAKFFDAENREITRSMRGGLLEQVRRIERPIRLPTIRAACDVTNPLCGPRGAAVVYGPQKGATPAQVAQLDDALSHFARIVGGDPNQPGMGAAGGAPFGLVHLCGARLERGIDLVLDALGFDARCRQADLVITGEGRLDGQSQSGKACMGVAAAARRANVPVKAIVGSTEAGWEQCVDPRRAVRLDEVISLSQLHGSNRATTDTASVLTGATADLLRRIASERI